MAIKYSFFIIDVDGNVQGTNDQDTAMNISLDENSESVVIDVESGKSHFGGEEHEIREASDVCNESGGGDDDDED